MRSRTIREGSVGLLILLGLALFTGIILWLRGLTPGNRSYRLILEFANAAGMKVGGPVRYRGVSVGRIITTRPKSNSVEVEVEISPADLVIPRNSIVEANQGGLLGETAIDITPVTPITEGDVKARPLDRACNSDVILCNKSRIAGRQGASVDELVRASIKFANVYTDPKFFENVNAVVKNSSEAAAEITKLSREVTLLTQDTRQEIKGLSSGVSTVVASASQAADEFTVTARQINVLIDANRYSLAATLDNINQTSAQLRSTVQSLDQATTRVTQGDLLRNLEALSVNAAQASANLRDASQSLNNPANLTMLQQTLDAARDTFLNARKITAELDDLTGDPAFRDNLRNLINGLSRLLSSTQQLQQQARVTQLLVPLANQSSRAASSTANIPPNTPNLVPPETLPQETNPQPSNVPTQAP